MKFGGTSVATPERLRAVARRLATAHEQGDRVVGVLSAMGHATDELVALAHAVSPAPHPRELDMLVTTGERVSCALCSMALHDLGHEAVSLTGSQAGIQTDTVHGEARIVAVRPHRIEQALELGRIVLVAGFQGVSTEQEVTTLGRGGSDLTAVALAAALGADVCEIYTDVDGVYTADPRRDPDARRYERLSFDEMEALAAAGAQVLQLRSVQAARARGVALHVRSASGDAGGTWITEETDPMPTNATRKRTQLDGRAD
jgi:aspartate kinase